MLLRAICLLVLFVSSVRADNAVALLPLDAQAKLDVYGQVVASEIAQALIAGKIDVVVVLPKMAVPEHAKLIVDGKIAQGKGAAIELSIRVREPKSVTIVQQFSATAASLETLDRTTKELAAQVLPVLRGKLAELAQPPAIKAAPTPALVEPPRTTRPLLVAVGARRPTAEPLRSVLAAAVTSWTTRSERAPSVIELAMLDAKTAAKTVAGSKSDRGIAFEVLEYELWGDWVPMGRARVRVRIADASQVLFDRVVVTDTIVGEREMPVDVFAARVAREVLAIVQPHVKKAVPGWQ
ncbi:MAG TPA: hypothetical protein VK427_02345 [Kofleriaceae bacterium]|nr:hypothetical protein [Kofleriaceae bacterium]